MKRDPSIHLRLSDLISILHDIGIDSPEDTAAVILDKAHRHATQLTHRVLVKPSTRTKNKVANVSANSATPDIDLFQSILNGHRHSLKHNYISQITPSSADYTILQTVVKIADKFCQQFTYTSKNMGYIMFCKHVFTLIRKDFTLSKIKYHAERIFALEEASVVSQQDPTPSDTATVASLYSSFLTKHTPIVRYYNKNDSEWVHFVHTKTMANTHKAKYVDWIEAQFDYFVNVIGTVPNYSQLYNAGAIERYTTHMMNKDVRKTKDLQDAKSDYSSDLTDYFKHIQSNETNY